MDRHVDRINSRDRAGSGVRTTVTVVLEDVPIVNHIRATLGSFRTPGVSHGPGQSDRLTLHLG
jgi:hypothetical protein